MGYYVLWFRLCNDDAWDASHRNPRRCDGSAATEARGSLMTAWHLQEAISSRARRSLFSLKLVDGVSGKGSRGMCERGKVCARVGCPGVRFSWDRTAKQGRGLLVI